MAEVVDPTGILAQLGQNDGFGVVGSSVTLVVLEEYSQILQG